jgi:hypothetical protein
VADDVSTDFYRSAGAASRDNRDIDRDTRDGRGRFVGRSEVERFLEQINVVPGGCWIWTGLQSRDGYPRFVRRDRRVVRAHRYAYEWLVGPIPEGRTLDHLIGPEEPCTSRRCVRTGHLEPVTNAENVRRRHARRRLNGVT